MATQNTENQNNHIALFKGKTIRRTIYQKELKGELGGRLSLKIIF